MAEVYGNLVIVVILVMEGVDKAMTYPPTMPRRHALYDSKRLTDRRYLNTASIAKAATLGSMCDSYRGIVSYRY